MQIVRFCVGDATRYGVLEGSSVLAYSGTVLPPQSDFVEHEAELAVVMNPVVKL
jgi:2-keto-4-pentenoate hydratase/2-oxohepta-3-ene-1,7-dioic acid hydratase in catechol pathway